MINPRGRTWRPTSRPGGASPSSPQRQSSERKIGFLTHFNSTQENFKERKTTKRMELKLFVWVRIRGEDLQTNKCIRLFFFLTFHSLPFPIWIIQRVDASLFGLNWTSYIWVHFELPLSGIWKKGQVKYERQQWQLILKGTPQLKI